MRGTHFMVCTSRLPSLLRFTTGTWWPASKAEHKLFWGRTDKSSPLLLVNYDFASPNTNSSFSQWIQIPLKAPSCNWVENSAGHQCPT